MPEVSKAQLGSSRRQNLVLCFLLLKVSTTGRFMYGTMLACYVMKGFEDWEKIPSNNMSLWFMKSPKKWDLILSLILCHLPPNVPPWTGLYENPQTLRVCLLQLSAFRIVKDRHCGSVLCNKDWTPLICSVWWAKCGLLIAFSFCGGLDLSQLMEKGN